MAAFDLALSRVREDADHFLLPARINQLARAGGYFFRDTQLNPGNTLRLFAQQIANGNIACSAVHHPAGADFSDTAWCQARQSLPMQLIEQVHHRLRLSIIPNPWRSPRGWIRSSGSRCRRRSRCVSSAARSSVTATVRSQ